MMFRVYSRYNHEVSVHKNQLVSPKAHYIGNIFPTLGSEVRIQGRESSCYN